MQYMKESDSSNTVRQDFPGRLFLTDGAGKRTFSDDRITDNDVEYVKVGDLMKICEGSIDNVKMLMKNEGILAISVDKDYGNGWIDAFNKILKRYKPKIL